MSSENKAGTEGTPSPTKPALNLNLDYLVPTLSAIAAGLIHHICNKKEPITYVDVLLIISPSLPVLLGVIVKIITFIINWIANGTQSMNLGFLGTIIQKVNTIMNVKPKCDNTHSFDEKGRLIFHKYTVNIDISKKITEWQQKRYKITYCKDSCDLNVIKIVQHFTEINLEHTDSNFYFKNFYHEFIMDNEKIIVYVENCDNCDNKEKYKYNFYIISQWSHMCAKVLYFMLNTRKYKENDSYYRVSRIYNEYHDELLHTIKMYKANSINKRKVCMNFCFAGPPGTSKTYGARAIAKELTRKIFEINLSKIVYEEDFLALFSEENIQKYVFLLDEIDLMCPSREFDDKLIKSAEETRLTTFGVKSSNSSNTKASYAFDYDSENSSLTEEDGFGNKRLLHKINILQGEIQKLHEKMDKTFSFQEWLKEFLERLFSFMCISFIPYMGFSNSDYAKIKELLGIHKDDSKYDSKNDSIHQIFLKYVTKYYIPNSLVTDNISSNIYSPKNTIQTTKTPFTLRTLLNFISGGNTPDDLVIIATTNRPEKLDPALIRPGRLRLIEFKNLRKVDAVSMLLENYPDEQVAIEHGLDNIGYEDYMANGALLEAVMSSTHTLVNTLQTFQRELLLLKN